MATDQGREPAGAAGSGAPGRTTVRWDDTGMRSTYANVCNATSTREEVVLLFGMNQSWHGGQREVTVQLSDRIILSPFVAKRLSLLLAGVIREHEARFGPLQVEPRPAEGAGA
jgi:uncharacterized protein DUF3467